MTIEMTTLADVLKTWALPELKDAQKAFNKHPNGVNWNRCLRAMLTYQQLEFALRSSTVDGEKLMFDLESNSLGHWQDAVCRATMRMTCAHALRNI